MTDSEIGQHIGQLVSYYRDGWRTGTLEAVSKKGVASVRPIGPKGTTIRLVRIPVEDVKNTEK